MGKEYDGFTERLLWLTKMELSMKNRQSKTKAHADQILKRCSVFIGSRF
jgi:hypothetical protein